MPPSPTQTHLTQSQISKFITSHIRSLNLLPHETVEGKELIGVCLEGLSGFEKEEEFVGEEEGAGGKGLGGKGLIGKGLIGKGFGERYKADRERIVRGIRCMKIAGVLRMFRFGDGEGEGRVVGFRLSDKRQSGNNEEEGKGEEEVLRMEEVGLGEGVDGYVVDGENNEGRGQDVEGGGDEDEDESYRPLEEETQEDETQEVDTQEEVEIYAHEDVDESYRPQEEETQEEETQEEQTREEQTQEEEGAPRARNTASHECLEDIGAEATAERSQLSEVPSLELHRTSEQESIDHANQIRRHKEAYNAMAANAVPLISPPSEQPSMQTPSRKRARPFEVAASDDSSSFDPISPQRYANSTPRRSAKRMRAGTSLSGSRRTSAPGRLFASTRKCGSLSGFENLKLSGSHGKSFGAFGLNGTANICLKEEKKKDNSSVEVREIVRDLRDKYPDSKFDTDNGMIKCLDCDRSLKPTFHGVETHVRGKAHQNNIKEKISNPVSKQMAFKDTTLFPPKAMDLGIDFNIPQQPLAVYAQRAAQNLAATRAQYLSALENENHAGSIRMSVLESRQEKAEKQNTANMEKLKSSVVTSEEKVKTLSQDVTEKLGASEQRTRTQLLEVKKRLESVEEKNDGQLKSIEARIEKTAEDCEFRIDKLFTSVAKSDHRNIDNIDDLKANLRKLDEGTEEQLSELRAKIMDLEGMNSASQRDDLEASIRELENSDLESRSIHAKMESRLNDIEHSIRETENHVFAVEARLSDLQISHEQVKITHSELQVRIEELEGANAHKEEAIHDLEANLQMLTEDLQRQRDGNLHYQKTIKDQVEAHFLFMEISNRDAAKATAKREEETKERERVMEERLMNIFERRLERIERKNEEEREASNKKIQRLREKNRELQGELGELQARVVPLIFEDAQDMKEKLIGVEEKVEALEGLAVKMKMGGRVLEPRGRVGSEGVERREVTV
ncbi:hypothetical protein ONS96_005971 [Cadophora gregata f. sp. sojae]|nr:hypothetical protein ONS96_005971 [Cadophora gregata f. sp. sojae]